MSNPLTTQHGTVARASRAGARIVSYKTVGRLTAISDYLLISLSCLATAYGYHYFILHELAYFPSYFGIAIISGMIFIILSTQLYHPTALLSLQHQTKGIFFNWMALLLILFLILFLLKVSGEISRGALTLFGVLSLLILLGSRKIICAALASALAQGRLTGYPAIVIGDSASLGEHSPLEILQRYGADELARFEVSAADKLGAVDTAIAAARAYNPAWILLSISWANEDLRKLVCERLRVLPLPVFLLPDNKVRTLLGQFVRQVGSELTFEVQRAPLSSPELAAKRGLDLMLATVLLILLSPILAIAAVAIKLESSGPVIFRQRRPGFNGREFRIYKFRTMKVLEDGGVTIQTKRTDPRVTRVGRVLRVTSIDELPQLINVLFGQMSLVGPRPHTEYLDNGYSKLITRYAFRQHVQPGLTGWAQVNGFRGETSKLELMKQRVDHDLWYINNWSIWLDIRIILRTPFEIMRGRNAH